ncbi:MULTISPECIES: TonB-dependent receptor [unclassified Pseudoalteromonas]|uniref:TonB-dependent receptor n=1 Tax=unclassified Pseudoalteromonas TaxID=194690 RepID=UPI0015FFB889|nr:MULTISPECIES: TonB-dependent receptor [unclassified Pseudoalteromonas]MBB1416605.1 TonB-dependent receptor [Pseudoalteromonas sp. SG44-1]MBB1434612.1 TonB-dependent receptor [Pseudoalteromonas sp. SG43-6]
MKKFNKKLLAATVAAAVSISSNVYAADTGGLKIRVTDKQGQPIAGATVSAKSPESLIGKQAVSDSNGYVSLRGLDPSSQYIIDITGASIQPFEAKNVRVITDKNLNLNYAVDAANGNSDIEKIVVSGRSVTAIDTTSSSTGLDVTLDMTESLPTGRNFQSYLQLVPGVKPSTNGNPSSKSGVNYVDIGGEAGSSSDNVYYIDGVNVTDNADGTAGGNINSEIIQEQQVLTGGIEAKYAGGAGLVSRVITKSGGNEFHGSINYYFQNDSLVGDYDNESKSKNKFSTYDTAITLGGPIIKDKLWFFASYQLKNREDDITNTETGEFSHTVEDDTDLGFGKITWQATDRDRLVFTYFNDPRDLSGSRSTTTVYNRQRTQKTGGDNYKIDYSHSWDDFIINAGYMEHEAEFSTVALDKSTRSDIAFLSTSPSQSQTDIGGLGADTIRERNKKAAYIDFTYYLDTDFGDHTFEAGYSVETNENISNSVYNGGPQYNSIAASDSGVTFETYATGQWTGEKGLAAADYTRVAQALNDSGNLHGADLNNDGVISDDEVKAIVFDSTANNPTGDVNAYQIEQVQQATSKLETKGKMAFLQDTFTIDNVTIKAGLRAEKWDHIASTGETIFTFDWEVAPRLSVIYDIFGDGDSKVWAFGGRYYDPLRTDMTSFAGNLTGSVLEERVYVNDDWVTFRTRGGAKQQDAFFSPSTKTPYTDEYLIGYSTNLTDSTNISVTYTKRTTKDIMEDYDLSIYSEDGYMAGTSLELPLSYFGYDENPGSNYVIGTLAGAKRDYEGIEVTFKKLRADNWFMLASYTHNDAKGNSNSDGNADFQGDWEILDPRAPNMYGKQPGNVEHQFKILGTYYFDNNFEVGAVYNWNSGTRYSKAQLISGRYLPLQVDEAYEFGGYETNWVADNSVGSEVTPSYGTLDIRVKYTHDFDQYKAEFFLDIFNILDDQATTVEQGLASGDGNFAFGEATDWVEPRRFYLGARLSF